MKVSILSLILIFGTMNFSTAEVTSGEKITANKFNNQTFTVGDIKHSLLNLSQFQNLMGDCWVKMQGQDITGSDYASITGKSSLPNASGKFLRGIGGNAPLLGEAQTDAFQGHGHDFYIGNTSSSFNHLDSQDQIALANNAGSRSLKSSKSGAQDIINSPISNGYGNPRIANETRPENIGVNYFIKINHQCN